MNKKFGGLVSIAVPTRNRGHMVADAIHCCLGQTYTNIEVVVADNSDDDRTYLALKQLDDPRLRYVRTGRLSMADNWQAALEQCNGEYLFIIGDKILLNKDAVSTLTDGISQFRLQAYSFSHDVARATKNGLRKWRTCATDVLVRQGLQGNIQAYSAHGFCGYSLVISREMFRQVTEKIGAMSLPVSPDYTLGFLASFSCERFAYREWCPFRYNYKAPSTGFSSITGGRLTIELLEQYGMSMSDIVDHAPIKVFTIWNGIQSDFFRMCEKVGKPYSMEDIDMVAYWKRLYAEVMHYYTLTHIDQSERLRILFEQIEKDERLQSIEIGKFVEDWTTLTVHEHRTLSGNAGIRLARRALGKASRVLSELLEARTAHE